MERHRPGHAQSNHLVTPCQAKVTGSSRPTTLKKVGEPVTQRATLRNALVVGEVALALVLAAGAALLMKSLFGLTAVHPGFDPHNVLTFRVDLPSTRYPLPQRIEFYRQLMARLKALPAVEIHGWRNKSAKLS